MRGRQVECSSGILPLDAAVEKALRQLAKSKGRALDEATDGESFLDVGGKDNSHMRYVYGMLNIFN